MLQRPPDRPPFRKDSRLAGQETNPLRVCKLYSYSSLPSISALIFCYADCSLLKGQRSHELQNAENIHGTRPLFGRPTKIRGDRRMGGMDQHGNRPPDPSAVNMHYPGCRPSKTTAPSPLFFSHASQSPLAQRVLNESRHLVPSKVQKVLFAKGQRIHLSADAPPSAHQGDPAPFLVQIHN